jgi:tetratricopeptide (TPR) repeat protein
LPNLSQPALTAPHLKSNPQLAALWQQGVLAQQQNKLSDAAKAYRALLRAKPDAFPAHVNLALVLLRQKENTQGVWHLKRAIALAPREVQPRLLLAQTYTFLKQPRAAFSQWTQLANIAQGQKSLKPIYLQATMTAGEMAFAQLKDLPSAEAWLRRANAALEGREPRTALMLGQVLGARGKHREAAHALAATAKLYPHTPEILSALADQQWQSGDQKNALITLRSLEKNTPATLNRGENLSRVRVLIARALAGQKQYSQAAAMLKNALAVLPVNSPALKPTQQQLAQTLAAQAEDEEKRGKLQEATQTWGQASALFPDNPFAYAQRARLLEKQGDDRAALQQYQRALKLAPREANLLLRSAILEEKTGDAASALAQWKALSEVQPDYAPAYFNVARVGAKLQQLPSQMKYFETRLRKNPNQRAPYDAALEVGARSGQSELARDWVETMAKKYPKAAAPRNALIAFNREHAPIPQPQKTPTPIETPTPTPKPESTPVPANTSTPKPAPTSIPLVRSAPLLTPPSTTPDSSAPEAE